jgi:phosphate transport system substrate-binding protein
MSRLLPLAIVGIIVAVLAFLFLRSPGTPEDGGAGDGTAQQNTELQGEIKIDGSSTVYPVSEAIASAFYDEYPNVRATVGVSGTGGGFKRFVRGETDISDASRHIKWTEFTRCRDNGVSFIEVPVAYDGLSVVVNPENDWVDQLTVDQLTEIFSEGGADTWRDLNDNWPDEPIKIYAPGTDSGTFDYFREVVVGDEGSMRSDMSTSEDDNVLVTGVAGQRNSIAFFGAAYYFNNESKLRAVPIVNPETGEAAMPSPENVASGDYSPFSRPLFIYISERSLNRPEVKVFVDYYLDRAAEMAEKVDYVALPDELYERARQHVDQRHTGTHFWKEGGEERPGSLTEIYTPENLLAVEPGDS